MRIEIRRIQNFTGFWAIRREIPCRYRWSERAKINTLQSSRERAERGQRPNESCTIVVQRSPLLRSAKFPIAVRR